MKNRTALAWLILASTPFLSASAMASNVFCVTNRALVAASRPPHPDATKLSSVLVRAKFAEGRIESVDSLLVRDPKGNYKEFIQDGKSFRGELGADGRLSVSVQGNDLFTAFVWGGQEKPNPWVEKGPGTWFLGLMDMGLKQNALGEGIPQFGDLIEEDLWCRLD